MMARSTYYYYLKQKDKDKYESEKQAIVGNYNTNNLHYNSINVSNVSVFKSLGSSESGISTCKSTYMA